MRIRLVSLDRVAVEDIMALHNNPRVLRHLPLAVAQFDREMGRDWLQEKQQHWQQYGYGPSAILVDGDFAGWGGVQQEQGEADLALVLAPAYWGLGRRIALLLIDQAFRQWQLEAITALLPPSRSRLGGMQRMGFQPDGELTVDGERFLRFRLSLADYHAMQQSG